MPTNGPQHKGLSKWTHRFKTMVRYRLLFLTSAPIFLTLIALIGITIYWSIHYTWQNALLDVSERLGVANNSVTLLQQKQSNYVRAFADSYDFRIRINQGIPQDELQKWVTEQKKRYALDFLSFQRVNSMENKFRFMDLTKRESFFDVLNKEELERLDPELAKRAEVPILADGGMEARGLVSRTVIPVYSQTNDLIGFLDGGLLLNNSTVLVDQIRDLIYLSDNDRLRPVGTLTVFLDDLRVSTNVPLDSEHRLGRAIGTRVSAEVYNQVLSKGEQWVDRAYVYDAWYITAYQPIKDQYDNVIGMLYTGYLMWPFVKAYMTNIAEISLITIMLLLVSGVMVYRGSYDLFRPIERIHKVVKQVQQGKEKRIGPLGLDADHELAQLARQFDDMLDALEERKIELKNSAAQLECKVQERTASLREKTQDLELHIQLLNQTRDKLVVHEKLAALGELTAGILQEQPGDGGDDKGGDEGDRRGIRERHVLDGQDEESGGAGGEDAAADLDDRMAGAHQVQAAHPQHDEHAHEQPDLAHPDHLQRRQLCGQQLGHGVGGAEEHEAEGDEGDALHVVGRAAGRGRRHRQGCGGMRRHGGGTREGGVWLWYTKSRSRVGRHALSCKADPADSGRGAFARRDRA